MSFVLLGILNSQVSGAPAGAGAYDLLETTILGSDTASVSFTGLGSYTDYRHLQIRAVARSDSSASNRTSLASRFNNDSGSNYAEHRLEANPINSAAATSRTNMRLGVSTVPTSLQSSNIFGGAVIDILDFASTSKNTTARALAGSSQTDARLAFSSGLFLSTNAVTEIELFADAGNLVTGSRFSLYGIRAA